MDFALPQNAHVRLRRLFYDSVSYPVSPVTCRLARIRIVLNARFLGGMNGFWGLAVRFIVKSQLNETISSSHLSRLPLY